MVQLFTQNNFQNFVKALVLSMATVLTFFFWEGHQGFNLADEGFLWYGAQRVMQGEVPMRDFMSYDPGRYYWSAGLMSLWDNDGIMALRKAVAIFQFGGLFVGVFLLAHSRPRPNFLFLILATITLGIWMFPRHKLFDISLCLVLIGVLSFLVQKPTSLRYFLTGLTVGLVAVFGRNHGIYGVVGSLGVITYLTLYNDTHPGFFRTVFWWGGGVIVGYLPVLGMLIFVPGFAGGFWKVVSIMLEWGATNLFLPIPFPWCIPLRHVSWLEALRGILIGCFFIGIVLFGVCGITRVIWQKFQKKFVSPTLVAAVFLALPYAHFAYSRADVGHLAQGIFPFLLSCFFLLIHGKTIIRWTLTATLLGTSLFVTLPHHPGWQSYIRQQWVRMDIAGDTLSIDPETANNVQFLTRLVKDFSPNGQPFVAGPLWVSAYPLFRIKSLLWDIYPIGPRTLTFEKAEIKRLTAAQPGFIFILDYPLDGHDKLRFRNTHPLIFQYIQDHFERVEGYSNDPAYLIFRFKISANQSRK